MRRGARASRTRRSTPPGWRCAGARAGSTTSSAARSCSRSPTRAGGCAASGRARCGTGRGRSTSTRARARRSRRAASCSAPTSPARRRRSRAPSCWRRATPTSSRSTRPASRNAVGAMGTALTPEQASQLQRLAPVVLLCLDADAAGQQAAAKAATVLPDRVELRVVPLPPGADPADIVGEEGGAERMRALLDASVPFARFAIERILERGQDDEALTQVGAVIKPLPQGILRDGLVRLASSRLGISPDLVESAVRTARPQSVAPEVGGAPSHRQRSPPGHRPPRAVRAGVPLALRRPAGARRGEAGRHRPRRRLHLPAHPPRRRAPPRPPRAPVLRHRRRPRARRADPGDRPPRRPARRHPGHPRARGPPARPPPPRPRDHRRPDRGRGRHRSPRHRAPEGARRDPPPPAVEPKVRPTHELVFVSWIATGSKPNSPPAARSSRSRERSASTRRRSATGSRSTASPRSTRRGTRPKGAPDARRRRRARRRGADDPADRRSDSASARRPSGTGCGATDSRPARPAGGGGRRTSPRDHPRVPPARVHDLGAQRSRRSLPLQAVPERRGDRPPPPGQARC